MNKGKPVTHLKYFITVRIFKLHIVISHVSIYLFFYLGEGVRKQYLRARQNNFFNFCLCRLIMHLKCNMNVFCRPEPSLEGILKWWVARSHLKDGAPVSVVVHRGKLLQSTFRAVSRPNFNFLLPFHVSFSGEIGDDLGGPKREFFRYMLVRFI